MRFEETLQGALTDSVDRVAGSVGNAVSEAVENGLDKAHDEIKNAIGTALEPQLDRIQLKLRRLIDRLDSKLTPIFERLRSIANIQIGDNFSTISGVEVDITAIGISGANAFVGLPPDGGHDFSKPFASQDGLGLFHR